MTGRPQLVLSFRGAWCFVLYRTLISTDVLGVLKVSARGEIATVAGLLIKKQVRPTRGHTRTDLLRQYVSD